MRLAVFLLAVAALMYAADPAVTLANGQLRGISLTPSGAAFKGIPFAEPPVGDLRWREPRPLKPWTGVWDAVTFRSPCSQNSGGAVRADSSEDCLFLNIWTPNWPPRDRLPVMVWLHGGGNYGGTASSASFDGESLARHGVVLVTVNYRLTVFGFLAHPELTRESPHHTSGNYGLLDQIAALEWVRGNIAKFGGNPGNVTLFGQSAGAVDANVLMTSPLAKGLFHRVIAESGTVTRNPDPGTMSMTALGALMPVKNGPVTYSDAPTLAEAEKKGEALAAGLRAPATGTLKFMRQLPAAELLKAVSGPQMSIGPANGVVADGWVFPAAPAEVFAKGREHRVPLLVGNNARERTPPVTLDDLPKPVEAMYGPLATRALSLYGIKIGDPVNDPLYGGPAAQWVVDTMYRCPVVAQLVWHAAAGNVSYEYQFDHAAPGREAAGSVHGTEVPYVFGNLGDKVPSLDREISAAMQTYWTNFAKMGDPNGSGIEKWPRFDATAKAYLEFTDNGPVAREGLRRPYCDLYIENVKRLMAR